MAPGAESKWQSASPARSFYSHRASILGISANVTAPKTWTARQPLATLASSVREAKVLGISMHVEVGGGCAAPGPWQEMQEGAAEGVAVS